MPKLVLRKPWTSQPQVPAGIDWRNPLTSGLVGAWYPAAGLFNVVDRKALASNLLAYSVSPNGTVADFNVNHGSGPYIQFGFDLSGAGTVYALVSRDISVSGVSQDAVAELYTDRTAGQTPFWELNLGNAFGAAPDIDKPRFSTDLAGIGTIYLNGTALSGNNPATTALNNKQFYSVAAVASSGITASGSGVIVLGAANLSGGTVFQLSGRVALSLIFNTAKSATEIAAISANPWQLFAPLSRSIWVPAAAGGGVTHATTGALVANAATVSGTAAHLKLHTSTGALTGQGAAIAGVAAHLGLHTTTGALVATAATVAGAASRLVAHPSTGALVASASAISGAAAHVTVHGATGALVASAAVVAGAAARSTAGTHTTSGALTGQSANIAGTAAHVVVHATTGSLAGQSANIMGTAAHLMLHAASGALAAQSANITGAASRPSIHSSIAAMIAQSAIIVGSANRLAFGASTIGRPVSDTSTTGWVASSGGALYAMVNEAIPDASTYVYTTTLGQMCEMALNAMQYPGSAAQVLMFRGSSQSGNSVIVRLINTSGATVRVIEQALTPVDTQYSATLSAGEVAAIASGALSIQLESA